MERINHPGPLQVALDFHTFSGIADLPRLSFKLSLSSFVALSNHFLIAPSSSFSV
jgi:hypothetical protein